MPDPDSRSAAKLAALVALPVAVLTGVAVFLLLGDVWAPAPPPASPSLSPTATPVPTSPVSVPARELTDEQQAVCRALLARVPGTVGGQPQRPVTEGPERNAAYGEPPVTLACGGPEPVYDPTDEALTVSGVCWHAAGDDDGTVWTTLDRTVPVRVSVPDAYEGQLVVEFSAAILAAVPAADDIPFGCTG